MVNVYNFFYLFIVRQIKKCITKIAKKHETQSHTLRYSEEKNNIFRKIFRHFSFINYIILYNKTYTKIHYKSYNNYKCHHRNKINNLPIKKNIELPIKLL